MAREFRIVVGTAGWSIRREHQHLFEPGPSHLARYAAHLCGVEINSSFYRPHRQATYAKWAASVPAEFHFAVKMPRAITHEARLVDTDAVLEKFLLECAGLGDKLGPLLIQLPPSLKFDASLAAEFLAALRAQTNGAAVLEPRHVSWFTGEADTLLREFRVGRVAADPPPADVSKESVGHPAGDRSTAYFRLHGSPRIYYSDYSAAYLRERARHLRAAQSAGADVWCIFDNTALGHAAQNALTLRTLLDSGP